MPARLPALALALAAALAGDGAEPPEAPPSRIPADFDPAGAVVSDRLAAWVPADAAAAFFGSLAAAEAEVAGLAADLARALPPPGPGRGEGSPDPVARAMGMLLLPPIWRANPGVRTGTRQVALVASDLDLGSAPDLALLCEVDDATLVRTHRQATFSFEDRSPRRLRVEGLDAWSDDGSVRSFFALEAGVAVWSTSRSLRDRVLAAGAGRAPSLLRPDPRALALARAVFPDSGGGVLVVLPDAFLARLHSGPIRARRAEALGCETARRATGAAGTGAGGPAAPPCPSGGSPLPGSAARPATCSIHGSAAFPTPLGDLPAPAATPSDGPAPDDAVSRGAYPVALHRSGGALRALLPPGSPGRALAALVAAPGTERVAGRQLLVWGGR